MKIYSAEAAKCSSLERMFKRKARKYNGIMIVNDLSLKELGEKLIIASESLEKLGKPTNVGYCNIDCGSREILDPDVEIDFYKNSNSSFSDDESLTLKYNEAVEMKNDMSKDEAVFKLQKIALEIIKNSEKIGIDSIYFDIGIKLHDREYHHYEYDCDCEDYEHVFSVKKEL